MTMGGRKALIAVTNAERLAAPPLSYMYDTIVDRRADGRNV